MSDPVPQATHTTRRLPTLAGIWLCVALATAGCGAGHSSPADDSTDNLPDAPGAATAGRATRGADLYVTAGCFSCHSTDGTPLVGPSLRGLVPRAPSPWPTAATSRPPAPTCDAPSATPAPTSCAATPHRP